MISHEFLQLIHEIELLESKFKAFSKKYGNTNSQEKGNGLNFKDIKSYNYGDDFRLIDWNVSSRFQDLFVREYYEEKEKNCIIFLDFSESMDFQSSQKSKKQVALEIAGFLSLLYIKFQNKISIINYSDKIELDRVLLKNKKQVYQYLFQSFNLSSKNKKTNHELPYHFLKTRCPKKSDVYILSDFVNFTNFSKFKPFHHYYFLNGIQITDDLETNFNQKLFSSYLITNSESKKTNFPKLKSTFTDDFGNVNKFFKNRYLGISLQKNNTKNLFYFMNEKL